MTCCTLNAYTPNGDVWRDVMTVAGQSKELVVTRNYGKFIKVLQCPLATSEAVERLRK